MRKALILGGGFAGCIAAEMLGQRGWHRTVVEAAPFLGGGCKTQWWGGHPYTFGPRHFLTKDEAVWDYFERFVPMRRIPEHEFLTFVERDPGWYHFPIHVDEVGAMPDAARIRAELEQVEKVRGAENARNLEEYWIRSVGPTLYGKFVETYTKKMWKLESNKEFDDFVWSQKGTPLKRGAKAAWTEAISGFPRALNGYDDYFDMATKGARVLLNTKVEAYDLPGMRVRIGGRWSSWDLIVNTLAPEVVMDNAFGPLRWMGREFLRIVLPSKEVFPKNVYFLYYANDEPFTRIVEYKKFYAGDADSPTTLLGLEIPVQNGRRDYAFPMKKEVAKAQRYLDAMPENVYSIGRMGSYRYLGVSDCIAQCFDMMKDLGADGGPGGVPPHA